MTPYYNGQTHSIRIRISRHLAGSALAASLFHFVWASRDLQEWLIPFLFLAGALVAIVAGKPLGWLVAAFCLWGWAIIDFVRDYFAWGPFYNWNLGEILLHQEVERAVIVLYFSVVLIIGGLAGWTITLGATRFQRKGLRS